MSAVIPQPNCTSRLERRLNSKPKQPMISTVPLTLEQIIEETRQLPTDVVAELVEGILLARHGGIDPELEAAWRTEIDRRIEEIEKGKVQGIPAEESMVRIRRSIGQ